MAQKKISEIIPNEEQKKCIDYNSGDLMVNGYPGAGKSVVLMQRAWKMYSAASSTDKNVVFLTTFTTKLDKNTKELFKSHNVNPNIMTIQNMDSFCAKIYRDLVGRFTVIKKEQDRIDRVEKARRNYLIKHPEDREHRFFAIDAKFFAEEILWIKDRNISTLEQYKKAERTGRGGSVVIRGGHDKEISFGIFAEYQAILKFDKLIDWGDIYMKLLNTTVDLSKYKFTYVMVDEAQDFSFAKLAVAKKLTKKDITVAADRAQKIYNTGFTWSELGINVRGNASKTLHNTFRSTKQIIQLAESLADVNRAIEKDKGEYTDPILPTRIGADYPTIIKCIDSAQESLTIVKLLNNLVKGEGSIGVFCRDYNGLNIIRNLFRSNHIPYQDLMSDTEPWSLFTSGVKLVTMHSSKGLEFDTVIIPFFTDAFYPSASVIGNADDEQKPEIMISERNLVYVGMTRAKASLYMVYSGNPSPFIKEFNPNYYNYVTPKWEQLEKPRFVAPEKIENPIVEETKATPALDSNAIQGKDRLKVHILGSKKSITLLAATTPAFVGKKVGDKVNVNGTTYVVDSIAKAADAKPQQKVKKPTKEIPTWEKRLEQIADADKAYIKTLIAVSAPVATTINAELIGPSGDVIAKATLAWEIEKVVYLSQNQKKYASAWEKANYKVIDNSMKADINWFK